MFAQGIPPHHLYYLFVWRFVINLLFDDFSFCLLTQMLVGDPRLLAIRMARLNSSTEIWMPRLQHKERKVGGHSGSMSIDPRLLGPLGPESGFRNRGVVF